MEIRTNQEVKDIVEKIHSIRNLAMEGFVNAFQGKPILVPDDIKESRLSTCQSCEKFLPETYRCAECGCFMNAKTAFAPSSCPLGKWGKYHVEQS